jgi:hypothetical protein
MKMLEKYDFRNPAEMLYAVGRYEPTLHYNINKDDQEVLCGSEVRKYFAHILVCKECHKYLFDFLMLLDQSVAHHPYPNHVDVSKDRLNDAGIPIFEYVLDADFDVLRDKAYYGITDDVGVDICKIVETFMSRYILIAVCDGPII